MSINAVFSEQDGLEAGGMLYVLTIPLWRSCSKLCSYRDAASENQALHLFMSFLVNSIPEMFQKIHIKGMIGWLSISAHIMMNMNDSKGFCVQFRILKRMDKVWKPTNTKQTNDSFLSVQ
jgi:hypothetical protein